MLLILLNRMNCPPHSSSSGFLPQKKKNHFYFCVYYVYYSGWSQEKKEHPQNMYERGSLPTDKIPAKKSLGHFSYTILGCHKIPFRDFSWRKLIFTKSYLILFQFLLGLTLQFWVLFLSHWTVIKWSNSQHKKSSIQWKQRKCVLAVWIILKKKPFFTTHLWLIVEAVRLSEFDVTVCDAIGQCMPPSHLRFVPEKKNKMPS